MDIKNGEWYARRMANCMARWCVLFSLLLSVNISLGEEIQRVIIFGVRQGDKLKFEVPESLRRLGIEFAPDSVSLLEIKGPRILFVCYEGTNVVGYLFGRLAELDTRQRAQGELEAQTSAVDVSEDAKTRDAAFQAAKEAIETRDRQLSLPAGAKRELLELLNRLRDDENISHNDALEKLMLVWLAFSGSAVSTEDNLQRMLRPENANQSNLEAIYKQSLSDVIYKVIEILKTGKIETLPFLLSASDASALPRNLQSIANELVRKSPKLDEKLFKQLSGAKSLEAQIKVLQDHVALEKSKASAAIQAQIQAAKRKQAMELEKSRAAAARAAQAKKEAKKPTKTVAPTITACRKHLID